MTLLTRRALLRASGAWGLTTLCTPAVAGLRWGITRGGHPVVPRDTWADASIGIAPTISAPGMLIRDFTTGQNLLEKSPDVLQASNMQGSTGKMMAVRTALKWISGSLDSTTVVLAQEQSVNFSGSGGTVGGTCLLIRTGDTLSARSLMWGMLLNSGNDCAEVLARFVGETILGSTSDPAASRAAFISEMNVVAASLGLASSFFGSPSGVDTNPYSSTVDSTRVTARDMMRLLYDLWLNPTILALSSPTIQTMSGTPSHNIPVTAGPSSPSITCTAAIPIMEPLSGTPFSDLLCAKGGSNGGGYSTCAIWRTPAGHDVGMVIIASTSQHGDRDLDTDACRFEVYRQFTALDGVADTDASFSSNVLLMGGESGFTDESPVGNSISQTAVTRATSNLITGSFSYQFDGSTSFMSIPDSDNFNFGTADFCIEDAFCWSGAAPTADVDFISKWDATIGQQEWRLWWDNTNSRLSFSVSTTGSDVTTATWVFDLITKSVLFNGSQRRLMARRSAGVAALYLDGVKGANVTMSAAMFNGTAPVIIGGQKAGSSVINFFRGTQDEIRIAKGAARQTVQRYTTFPRPFARS